MSTNKNSNRIEVPEAKQALDQFKMEVADELGVPLTNGYNGNSDLLPERKCRRLYGEEDD